MHEVYHCYGAVAKEHRQRREASEFHAFEGRRKRGKGGMKVGVSVPGHVMITEVATAEVVVGGRSLDM